MATPLSDSAIEALQARHNTLTAQVRARVLAFITRMWGGLESHRDGDIERFVTAIVPIIEGGQYQLAALTDAHLAIIEGAALGTAVRPVGVNRAALKDLRGVPIREVYRRAGVEVWTALSNDVPYSEAVQRGLKRATTMADTDLQLAETHTARRVLAGKDNVVGYRRVLTGAESCALCAVASTQRYTKERLMPVHDNCDCKVRPIYGDRDPGRVLDSDLLESLKGDLADRFGTAYSDRTDKGDISTLKRLVVTHEHGELGPVLARKGDAFTSAKDLGLTARQKRRIEAQKRWDENLAAARRHGGLVEVDPKTLRAIEPE